MKYLIFGSKGQLGSKFIEIFTRSGVEFAAHDYDTCDITDLHSVINIVRSYQPAVILNCAAYNLVDEAEKNNKIAESVNFTGTQNIAAAAKETGAFMVHYGTDYVFDGQKGDSYMETDRTNPINEYGKSKLRGEQAVSEILVQCLILRLSWVYGNGIHNFIYKFTEWASKNQTLNITEDEFSIPTSVDLIAESTLKALDNNMTGLYHLTASGIASRLDWANEIIKLKGLKTVINPVPISFFNLPAKRPYNSSMSNHKISAKIGDLPDWKEDLRRFLIGGKIIYKNISSGDIG